MQTMAMNGSSIDFVNVWTFGTPRTLINQFLDAYNSGVSVAWEITTAGGYVYNYSGTWRYSNNFNRTSSELLSGGSDFSYDDGLWGANNGTVDGNGNGNIVWGHGNYDSSDSSTCYTVYMNGSSNSASGLVNMMYYR